MKIYCDFDNTFIDSDRIVVNIINNLYGVDKSVKDIKDWGYRSIYPGITDKQVEDIYNTPGLYQREYIFDNALEFLSNKDFIFCTIGQKPNIEEKIKFSKEVFGFEPEILHSNSPTYDKSLWDMSYGIQIDDNIKNLINTNAKYKILFKNFNNYSWQIIPPNAEIYTANTWDDIAKIIEYLEGMLSDN